MFLIYPTRTKGVVRMRMRCSMFLWNELHRERVHAVAGVLSGEMLTGEDVAEVGRAGAANYLGTLAVSI